MNAPERVHLFGLDAEVLARSRRGDGRHWVLKVERAGVPLVVKLYGRKRDWLRDALRDVGQRFVVGKTGMTPGARQRTEREVLAVWREAGFDVPLDRTDDPTLAWPAELPTRRLVSEFLPGRLLQFHLEDPAVPAAEKQRVLATLAAEWGRRHALAIARREPRLVQAHAMLGHVLHVAAAPGRPERIVTFDFEVAWARPHDLRRLVSLELAQYLDSIGRWTPAAWHAGLVGAIVAGYPDRAQLARLLDDVRRGRLPALAFVTRLGLALRERGSGRKLAMLEHLEQALRRG